MRDTRQAIELACLRIPANGEDLPLGAGRNDRIEIDQGLDWKDACYPKEHHVIVWLSDNRG
jgi:hypothetical protein